MAGTYNLLFIYTVELFPIVVRNAALGCTTQAAKIEAILAPFVVVLVNRGRSPAPVWAESFCPPADTSAGGQKLSAHNGQVIQNHPLALAIYQKKLLESGRATKKDVQKINSKVLSILKEEFQASKDYVPKRREWFSAYWSGFKSPE
ncbi:2-oxoglutarate dehydrogenase [Forsythia ovata]|uniref:2-oxoglutarate dehydrogenase n=1 Tax=Forsythia ovata TaxID=205694 RepID=A0ABD1QAJ9_9LAMI